MKYVLGIDFGNISQKVSSCIERIFSDASGLTAESGEFISNFCELHVCFRWNLLDHDHRLISDPSAVPVEFVHLFPYELRCDVQNFAECESVERLDLLRCDHKVIGDLVAYEDISVSVIDDTSGRIYGRIDHGVVFGRHLVLVLQYLNAEKFGNQDYCSSTETDKKFIFSVEFHVSGPSYFRSSVVRMFVTMRARM